MQEHEKLKQAYQQGRRLQDRQQQQRQEFVPALQQAQQLPRPSSATTPAFGLHSEGEDLQPHGSGLQLQQQGSLHCSEEEGPEEGYKRLPSRSATSTSTSASTLAAQPPARASSSSSASALAQQQPPAPAPFSVRTPSSYSHSAPPSPPSPSSASHSSQHAGGAPAAGS